jgi:hypothetical protein
MQSASEEWAAGTVAIATIDYDSLIKFGTHLLFGPSVSPTNVTNITSYVTHNVLGTLSIGLSVNTELKGCGRKKSWLI